MHSQITYYQNKLAYEIDAWDLSEALNVNQNIVVIDTRSVDAYATEGKHATPAKNIECGC